MFSSIGPLEIVIVVVVLLLIFGPKRLPSLGRSLGTEMREFKESITGHDKRSETDATGRPALSETGADAPAPPAPQTSQAADSAPEQRA